MKQNASLANVLSSEDNDSDRSSSSCLSDFHYQKHKTIKTEKKNITSINFINNSMLDITKKRKRNNQKFRSNEFMKPIG